MSLADALIDLKNEVIASGVAVLETAAVDEIASDYSVNPVLLRRKFAESYPHPELLASSAAATDPAAAAKRWTAETIEAMLRRYDAVREQLRDGWWNTDKITVIGRIDRSRYLAVRQCDGSAWFVPMRECRFL